MGEEPFGTAWSVSRGSLATNVHVADDFFELEPGVTLWARNSADTPHEVQITSVKCHPGYKRFQELVLDYLPYDPQTRTACGPASRC
jgi:hypothetical protein